MCTCVLVRTCVLGKRHQSPLKYCSKCPDVHLLRPFYQASIRHDMWTWDSLVSQNVFHLGKQMAEILVHKSLLADLVLRNSFFCVPPRCTNYYPTSPAYYPIGRPRKIHSFSVIAIKLSKKLHKNCKWRIFFIFLVICTNKPFDMILLFNEDSAL